MSLAAAPAPILRGAGVVAAAIVPRMGIRDALKRHLISPEERDF